MADPFARISSMLESARDLTIEAAVSASTRLSETPTAKRPQEISKLLNSRTEREVLNGMKCVIALISRDEDGLPYFADVVKNVTLSNARVKALVLIYLQKYAETEPDTALLLINSIQKSLSDKKPNARSAAIRTLGGIRIPEIASLLVLCIKRTMTDSLPQVRAASALAIGKAFEIDGINKSQLALNLFTLLSDPSPIVVAASIKVYHNLKTQLVKMLAKKVWAPIHSNFRRYTRILAELDEWSTSFLIDILTDYTRKFLPRPSLLLADGSRIEIPDSFSEFPESYTCEMDSDLELLVTSLAPLSYASSDIVVLSSVKALATIATPKHLLDYGYLQVLTKIATQHANLLTKFFALEVVLKLALSSPKLFERGYSKFFLSPNDSFEVSSVKLHILLAVFNETSAKPIIHELQYYALNYKANVARMAINVMDVCSQKSARWSNKILKWCLSELQSSSATPILSELLTVIRHLLQEKQNSGCDNEPLVRTIYKLSTLLHDPRACLTAEARASIIWIIGEFTAASENLIGPDVLRRSLKVFAVEPEIVRYELLVLAAKSYLFELLRKATEEVAESRLGKIFQHIMHLCHYDSSFDTRDRVRMWDQLLVNSTNHSLATLFLEVPKPAPLAPKAENSLHPYLQLYLKPLAWADQNELPPKSIRKEVEIAAPITHFGNGGSRGKETAITSVHAVSSDLARNAPILQPTKTNQLQSLDEFFANDESDQSALSEEDSEEEVSDEEEDESSEAESSEEEEESDDDDSEVPSSDESLLHSKD